MEVLANDIKIITPKLVNAKSSAKVTDCPKLEEVFIILVFKKEVGWIERPNQK